MPEGPEIRRAADRLAEAVVGVRSLRVALETADAAILLYSASDVSMWRSDEVHAHPLPAKLGPDVLDPALDANAVAARLREQPLPALTRRGPPPAMLGGCSASHTTSTARCAIRTAGAGATCTIPQTARPMRRSPPAMPRM